MIKLSMKMPRNLYSEILMDQPNIPCRCALRDTEFTLELAAPLHAASGSITGWDLSSITDRAPAGAGGEFLFDCHAMLSVTKLGEDEWRVVDLEFFIDSVGWCPIFAKGEYAEVRDLDDVDDF